MIQESELTGTYICKYKWGVQELSLEHSTAESFWWENEVLIFS